MKKNTQLFIGIAFSVLCLVAIFLLIDPREIWDALRHARYQYLPQIIVLLLAYLGLRAVRWRYLLGNKIELRRIFHIQNIGYMLTQLLPFRLGDVARAVLVGSRPGLSVTQGVSTMVVERVLDLLFIVTLLPFTLAQATVLPEWFRRASSVSGVLALGATAILIVAANNRPLARRLSSAIFGRLPFLKGEKWVDFIDELLAGLHTLTHWRSGLTLIGLSIIIWIPMIFAYQSTLYAASLELNVVQSAFVVCAAALSIAAPSSPGQVGVFHAGVTAALVTVLGRDQAPSASFAFLYHAINFSVLIIVGLIGLLRTGSSFKDVLALLKTQRSPK